MTSRRSRSGDQLDHFVADFDAVAEAARSATEDLVRAGLPAPFAWRCSAVNTQTGECELAIVNQVTGNVVTIIGRG